MYSFLINYLVSSLQRMTLRVHYGLRHETHFHCPKCEFNSALQTWDMPSTPRPLTTFIQGLPAAYPKTESKCTLLPHSELPMGQQQRGGQGERLQHLRQLSVNLGLLLGTQVWIRMVNAFVLTAVELPSERQALRNQQAQRRGPRSKQALAGEVHRSLTDRVTARYHRLLPNGHKISI